LNDWECLVREHGPLVYNTAKRILGNAADAEDVAQEVLIEAHRLGQSRTVRHWGGFLRRLATCRAVDRLRQRRHHSPLAGLAGTIRDPGHSPEDAAIAKELAGRLRQALGQLPPREAEVFCLRYFEELSNQSIAQLLDMEPGAVAQALFKGRIRLEGLLSEAVKGA
jgi:RNA polymerase sigma-70 factor (ECF subfamily)